MNSEDEKIELTPVISACLESRGVKWEELSFPLRQTLFKRGCNEEMVNFILDHWTIYRRKDCIFFNSYHKENMVLSNMYPCKMYKGDKLFHSVDHLFHYLLAWNISEFDLAMAIQRKATGVKSGFTAKKMWRDFLKNEEADYDGLNEHSVQEVKDVAKLLYHCQEIKFDYCDEFRVALRESKHKNLVEFAPWDGLFGVLYNKKNRRYEGVNVCGKAMTQLRDKKVYSSNFINDEMVSVTL